MPNYNPNTVIAEANEKLTNGDYTGGQFLFQSALLQWTDDAREDNTIENGEAIATLWLAYTQYLIQGNQFKSASDAFEEAMDSCSSSGRIFAEAARYAIERNKRKTAQDIYIRAVKSITDEQDLNILWNDFLEMKQEEEPNLTMKELKEAIQEVESITPKPSEEENEEAPATKRAKVLDNKTHVVTKDEVEKIAETINLDELPEDIMLAWLSLDGSGPPQRPPISLFSPSPPKLSDPTAKDILGVDLAIQLIERLLESSGTLVLETCRGLWTLQAMKEQECQVLLQNAETSLMSEHEELEQDLQSRLAVAGAAADAVRRMNENDRAKFQQTANDKRQEVLKRNAWEIRKVLCAQQRILSMMQVPGFAPVGATVDTTAIDLQQRVTMFLHTSFFIRSKTGEDKHEGMLKAQLEKLKNHVQNSPVPDHGTAPMNPERLSPIPPSAYGQPPPPPPQYMPQPQYFPGNSMMMQQQGMMNHPQQAPMMQQMPPPPPPNQPNQFGPGGGYYQ